MEKARSQRRDVKMNYKKKKNNYRVHYVKKKMTQQSMYCNAHEIKEKKKH